MAHVRFIYFVFFLLSFRVLCRYVFDMQFTVWCVQTHFNGWKINRPHTNTPKYVCISLSPGYFVYCCCYFRIILLLLYNWLLCTFCMLSYRITSRKIVVIWIVLWCYVLLLFASVSAHSPQTVELVENLARLLVYWACQCVFYWQ